jgi:hypothetical protein
MPRLAAQPRTDDGLDRITDWPMPLHRDGFPLVLMWSPKSGCTTFVKWFLFQTGELDKALAYHRWVHKYRQQVVYSGVGYLAKLVAAIRGGKPIVKLVRDPWQRAVSSYLQLAQSRKLGPDDWAAKTRRALHLVNGADPARPTISFREFARALSQRSVAQDSINPHVAEQYSVGEERLAIRVIKLENFAGEIRAVESDHGLKEAPLDDLAQSRHHRGTRRVFVPGAADLQIDLQMFARSESPSYESFYDDETRALIATAFRRDIERYGYG